MYANWLLEPWGAPQNSLRIFGIKLNFLLPAPPELVFFSSQIIMFFRTFFACPGIESKFSFFCLWYADLYKSYFIIIFQVIKNIISLNPHGRGEVPPIMLKGHTKQILFGDIPRWSKNHTSLLPTQTNRSFLPTCLGSWPFLKFTLRFICFNLLPKILYLCPQFISANIFFYFFLCSRLHAKQIFYIFYFFKWAINLTYLRWFL